MKIELHPEASRELAAAADWYETRQIGLGGAFLSEIAKAFDTISESPRVWPAWPGRRRASAVRRFVLVRFPYSIAYSLKEEGVVIIGIVHARRRPGYWRRRWKR